MIARLAFAIPTAFAMVAIAIGAAWVRAGERTEEEKQQHARDVVDQYYETTR